MIIETPSCKPFPREKAISITHAECMCVAFVVQHAVRMDHTSFVPCPALKYLRHYLINGTIFEKLLDMKCLVCFPLLLLFRETFLILRSTERDIIENVQYIDIQVKYPFFLSDCNKTSPWTDFRFIFNNQIA